MTAQTIETISPTGGGDYCSPAAWSTAGPSHFAIVNDHVYREPSLQDMRLARMFGATRLDKPGTIYFYRMRDRLMNFFVSWSRFSIEGIVRI